MINDSLTAVTIVAATAGIRLVSADGPRLHVDEPVIAWEIHRGHDAHGKPMSSVFPVTLSGTDYEAYGVLYADGSVSGFGTIYDSLEEAQAAFPNPDV